MIVFASVANWNFDALVDEVRINRPEDQIVIFTIRNPFNLRRKHEKSRIFIPIFSSLVYFWHFIYSKFRRKELYESNLFSLIFLVFDIELLLFLFFHQKKINSVFAWASCVNITFKYNFSSDFVKFLYSGNSHILVQEKVQRDFNGSTILRSFKKSAISGYATCDYLIVESEYSKSTFVDAGISSEKVLIFHFRPSNTNFRKYRIDSEKIKVFFLGSRNLKGSRVISDLLEIACKNSLDKQQFEFFIGGSTISSSVDVTNVPNMCQEDFFEFLSGMDMILLPTWEDGGPRLLSEAINLGLFCLGSEYSKVPEFHILGLSTVIMPNIAEYYFSELCNYRKTGFDNYEKIDEVFEKFKMANQKWITEKLP